MARLAGYLQAHANSNKRTLPAKAPEHRKRRRRR